MKRLPEIPRDRLPRATFPDQFQFNWNDALYINSDINKKTVILVNKLISLLKMENTKKILEQFMKLPPLEKANVIDLLLKNLDEPDPSLDKLWAKEVEKRIDAFDSGKLSTVTEEEFFKVTKN